MHKHTHVQVCTTQAKNCISKPTEHLVMAPKVQQSVLSLYLRLHFIANSSAVKKNLWGHPDTSVLLPSLPPLLS